MTKMIVTDKFKLGNILNYLSQHITAESSFKRRL